MPETILCIHGAGSSGAIFQTQLTKIRSALQDDFEFFLPDGPHPSSPGPDVLPWFKDSGPYYSWFKEEDVTIQSRVEQINDAIRDAIQRWEMTKKDPRTRIVGIVAFSEGALSTTLLLWQQKMGTLPWLPVLQFAVLFCCYFRREAAEYMRLDANRGNKQTIDVPSLHVHGTRDFCLAGARRLLANYFSSTNSRVIEFDGMHHLPTKPEDIEEITQHILYLSHLL